MTEAGHLPNQADGATMGCCGVQDSAAPKPRAKTQVAAESAWQATRVGRYWGCMLPNFQEKKDSSILCACIHDFNRNKRQEAICNTSENNLMDHQVSYFASEGRIYEYKNI